MKLVSIFGGLVGKADERPKPYFLYGLREWLVVTKKRLEYD